jgi:uncharacterized protein (DUF488 family)
VILYTIGHSTRPAAEFAALLKENAVQRLADVRTMPRSRHNPQFNAEILARDLAVARIGYTPVPALGGLRHARKDSVNLGWKDASFRGYADYMQTAAFIAALDALVELARAQTVAVMCAEALPWRCHRSLIADALSVREVEVRHVMGPGKWQPHKLTPFAQMEGLDITYPFALEG